MPTPIWGTEWNGEKLIFDRPAEFKAYMGARRKGRYGLVVKEHRERRGSAANRYYFGVVVPIIADDLGWDHDDFHYEMRRKFLPDGEGPPRSSADLDTAEFARFIDDVRRLGAEHGVAVPDPGEIE